MKKHKKQAEKPYRITETELEKSVSYPSHRLPSSGSGPITGKRLAQNVTTLLYTDDMDATDNDEKSYAMCKIYSSSSVFYLKFDRDNMLFDINNKYHRKTLSDFIWREVTPEAFKLYSEFLKSHQESYYLAARRKII